MMLREGIPHIEDIPIKKFIDILRRLEKIEISEKIDGANLKFGLDERGRFYTSREGKGGKRYYSEKDYPIKFWTTGFRSAHKALRYMVSFLPSGMINPGEVIEVEILFGDYPNVVPYDNEMNQIVLLRPVGSADMESLRIRMDHIAEVMENKILTVRLNKVPVTKDGKTIKYEDEVTHEWKIVRIPIIDKSVFSKRKHLVNLESKLGHIEEYLNKPSRTFGDFTKFDILTWPLNRRPPSVEKGEWKRMIPIIRKEKEKIKKDLMKMKLNIKEDILDDIVRKLASRLGPPKEKGGWIEGIVFRDPDTGYQTKVVDKDIFSAAREFAYKIRNLLKRTTFGKKTSSVFERFVKDLAKILEIDEVPSKIRKMNVKLEIDENRRNDVLKLIDHYMKLLDKLLSLYLRNRKSIRYEMHHNNHVLTYDHGIHEKTMHAFAEMFEYLENFREKIKKNQLDTKDIFESRKIVLEGGNYFKDTSKITNKEIIPTSMHLERDLELPDGYLQQRIVGSAGKKKESGDIDIVLSPDEYDDIIARVKRNLPTGSYKASRNVTFLKYPIYDEYNERTNRYVQIDLNREENPDWSRFYHHYEPNTEFKNLYRHLLTSAIAHYTNRKETDEEVPGIGEPIEVENWHWSPKYGLRRVRRVYEVNRDGKWSKRPKIIPLGNSIYDPDTIAKILLGHSASGKDLLTIEKILPHLARHPLKAEIMKKFKRSIDEHRHTDPHVFEKVRRMLDGYSQ